MPEKQVKHRVIDRRNRSGDDADEDDDGEDSSEGSDNEDDSEDSDDASGEEEEEEEEEDDNGVAVHQTNGGKRLRAKFATCINCSDEFDVTDNGKYSCTWHPGIFALASPADLPLSSRVYRGTRSRL